MNPALIIIILLVVIVLWFLLSFAFIPIGKIISKIVKDAFDIMNKEDTEESEEEKKDE